MMTFMHPLYTYIELNCRKNLFQYQRDINGLYGFHCDNVIHQDMLATLDVCYARLKIFDNNIQGLTLAPYETYDNYQRDTQSYEKFSISYEQYMHNVIDSLYKLSDLSEDNSQITALVDMDSSKPQI